MKKIITTSLILLGSFKLFAQNSNLILAPKYFNTPTNTLSSLPIAPSPNSASGQFPSCDGVPTPCALQSFICHKSKHNNTTNIAYFLNKHSCKSQDFDYCLDFCLRSSIEDNLVVFLSTSPTAKTLLF